MRMFQEWFMDLYYNTGCGCGSKPERINTKAIQYTNKFKEEMERRIRVENLNQEIFYADLETRQYYIGLSLSACVKDIANGYIHISQVMGVIAGTKFIPEIYDQIDNLIKRYTETYWKGFHKDDCIYWFWYLLRNQLIIQPRNSEYISYGPNISGGHWIHISHATKQLVKL